MILLGAPPVRAALPDLIGESGLSALITGIGRTWLCFTDDYPRGGDTWLYLGSAAVHRGQKAAGRRLANRTWDEMPAPTLRFATAPLVLASATPATNQLVVGMHLHTTCVNPYASLYNLVEIRRSHSGQT